jgi:hypothetical protein
MVKKARLSKYLFSAGESKRYQVNSKCISSKDNIIAKETLICPPNSDTSNTIFQKGVCFFQPLYQADEDMDLIDSGF